VLSAPGVYRTPVVAIKQSGGEIPHTSAKLIVKHLADMKLSGML
jgi:hypothetical protein